MNYDELTAKELRELCEKRGIKPSRAKFDMIEDLKARDAADELSLEANLDQFEQDLLAGKIGGPVASETASDEVWPPEVPEELQKPVDGDSERPVTKLEVPHVIEDGVFYREFPRGVTLDQWEHESNLRSVEQVARSSGYDVFGPAFRDHGRSTSTVWVYGVNFR